MNEVDKLLNDLSKYQYTHVKEKVTRLQELLEPYLESQRRKQERHSNGLRFSPETDVLKEATRAQNILNGIQTMHNNAREEISYRDRAIQDILHAMEFLDCDDDQLLQYARELKDHRQMRREAKSFLHISASLVQFSKKNRDVLRNFNRVVKDMQDCQKQVEAMQYTPRELTQLEEAFERAKRDS